MARKKTLNSPRRRGTIKKKRKSRKSKKKRIPLKPRQFYCVQCRKRVTRADINIYQRMVASPKRINGQAVQIVSDCKRCKHQVQKFSKVPQANKYPNFSQYTG